MIRARRERDEQGVVLVIFGLTLITLITFAGFSVDVGNWYLVASRTQRAADAAALAGVVELPDLTGKATQVALDIAKRNGYENGVNAVVTVGYGAKTTQLKVTITVVVKNFFANLVGLKNETITRDATADYNRPLAMGNASNTFGNEPIETWPGAKPAWSNGGIPPKLWANIAGPTRDKSSGDAYQARTCFGQGVTADDCSDTNPVDGLDDATGQGDYKTQGDFFHIKAAPKTGSDLDIQVFDPIWAQTGLDCSQNLDNAQSVTNAFVTTPAEAAVRYEKKVGTNPTSPFCSGDDTAFDSGQVTTYIVRAPDDTPATDTDNPVLCWRQFQGVTAALAPLLDQTNAAYSPIMAEAFHRYMSICKIPGSSVVTGDYVLQVRTNFNFIDGAAHSYLPATSNNVGPANSAVPTTGYNISSGSGQNRYSVRAGMVDTSTQAVTASGMSVIAAGYMTVETAVKGATTTFYLTRVSQAEAGRVIELGLFDIGDVSGGVAGDIHFKFAGGGTPTACTGGIPGGTQVDYSTCVLSGVTSAEFNARKAKIQMTIPTTYTCTSTDQFQCWILIEYQYGATTNVGDTTSWQANFVGDPVRLVE